MLHQPRNILGLRRHVNDASGMSVPDHILPVAIGRGLHARLTASHDQSVQPLNGRLGNFLASLCQTFNFVECGVVAFDLVLVSLPAWKVLISPDHLGNLFLGQAVAFDHGRVVSRKQAGCLSQVCEYSWRDR